MLVAEAGHPAGVLGGGIAFDGSEDEDEGESVDGDSDGGGMLIRLMIRRKFAGGAGLSRLSLSVMYFLLWVFFW